MKYIAKALILLMILTSVSSFAQAETKKNLSKHALASYISGQLKKSLHNNNDHKLKEYCDQNGCRVVVQ